MRTFEVTWNKNLTKRLIPKDPFSIGKLYSQKDLPRSSSCRALYVRLSLAIVEKCKMLKMLKISNAKDLQKDQALESYLNRNHENARLKEDILGAPSLISTR